MTDEMLQRMYERKRSMMEVFATGTLLVNAIAIEYPKGCLADKGVERIIPTGSKILITMISRFGDVGIRDYDIDIAKHGYVARVDPCRIADVEFIC